MRRNMLSASAKARKVSGRVEEDKLKVQMRGTEKNKNNKMESEKEKGKQQGM
jgi:hypothetical protein